MKSGEMQGRIFRGIDGETFIISEKDCSKREGLYDGKVVIYVPEKTFDVVEKLVKLFENRLDYLVNTLIEGEKYSLYGDSDYHDKIVDFILLMNPDFHKSDISSGLSALGY